MNSLSALNPNCFIPASFSSNRFVAKIKLGKCLFAAENPFGKKIQVTVYVKLKFNYRI